VEFDAARLGCCAHNPLGLDLKMRPQAGVISTCRVRGAPDGTRGGHAPRDHLIPHRWAFHASATLRHPLLLPARQRLGPGDRARPRVHQHAPPRAELKKMRPQAGGFFDKSGARRTRRHPRRARSPRSFDSSSVSFSRQRYTPISPRAADAAAPWSRGPRRPSGAPARAPAG